MISPSLVRQVVFAATSVFFAAAPVHSQQSADSARTTERQSKLRVTLSCTAARAFPFALLIRGTHLRRVESAGSANGIRSMTPFLRRAKGNKEGSREADRESRRARSKVPARWLDHWPACAVPARVETIPRRSPSPDLARRRSGGVLRCSAWRFTRAGKAWRQILHWPCARYDASK